MHRVIGRNANPAPTASSRAPAADTAIGRTTCRTIDAPTAHGDDVRGAQRARARRSDSGISGASANRPSIATNTTSSATPAAINASVGTEPQPVTSVRTIPSTSSDSPTRGATLRRRDRTRPPLASAPSSEVAAGRRQRRDQADRDVDEQDPAPAEQIGDHAAEEHAGGAAGAPHRAPDPHRAVAGRPSANVVVRIDSEAGAMTAPPRPCAARAAISSACAVGEPAGERREREQGQPADEHAPAAEHVGGAAAEQQEAGERDRVGVDDPLQVLLGEAQRVADRRERDVHHGHVEDHHELRQATQQQRRAQVRSFGCSRSRAHTKVTIGPGPVRHSAPATDRTLR